MSLEALRRLRQSKSSQPRSLVEISSTDELAANGRDISGILAHREIETWFDGTANQPTDPSSTPDDPFAVPQSNLFDFLQTEKAQDVIQKGTFALDYPARLTRSAMAISGISARTERFKDVRKSQGFWIAMADLTVGVVTGQPFGAEEVAKSTELAKKVPSVLTDPAISVGTLPGVGASMTNFGTPESMEWIFDIAGELIIEANVIGAVKATSKKAMSKLMGLSYDAGEELTKKQGVKFLLGKMSDEELAAIKEASRFRQVGKLGTKPAQAEIDDAFKRTAEYIKESGEARVTKKESISAARRQGAARIHAAARQADKTGEYGPGFAARMRAAGRTEVTEKAYKPFLEVSAKASDDLTTLNKVIANHDFAGKVYTQANAHEALAKLYEYGELLTKGEVELLRDVLGNNFANSLAKFTVKTTGVAGKVASAAGKTVKGLSATSRTLMTTGELSFLLRQGNFRAWSKPSEAMRSFAVAARSLLSPEYARHMDDALRFRKAGKIGTEHGLFLGKFGDDVGRLTSREELFMADWLQKIPGINKIVGGFERGYVSGLNQLRVDWFDEGLQVLEATGKAGDDDLVAKWATYVNNMTGRADIDNIADANKALKAMAETSKQVLFAPRFAASKWNKHKVAAEIMFGKDTPNAMRRMLARDSLVRWRRYERLAHYAKQNGADVESNPRSSDFLKIKIGGTRFDILGGDTQIQVMLARLASGETKDTETKLIKDIAAATIALRFVEGKLNPMWSLAIDKFTGATFEGEDIDDPKVLAKVIRNKFIPLYLQDIKEKMFSEYETEGATISDAINGGVSTMVLGFAGAGVQTYAPSARKKYELMVNDKAQSIYSQDFADLTPSRKEEVLWEAENDNIDLTEQLKEEMGMGTPTRETAARMQKERNKATRQVRDGLGKDLRLFEDSNVQIRGLGNTIRDVRLNAEQHTELNKLFIKFIKAELEFAPQLSEMRADDFARRQWLEDIVSNAREDASEEIFYVE